MKKTHPSYGIISISKFSSTKASFFGSDIFHSGGVSITISTASKTRSLHKDYVDDDKRLININMSYQQFVDAITSGMNTNGVPCTITSFNGETIDPARFVEDKKTIYVDEMIGTQSKYIERINSIIEMIQGNIGKKKQEELIKELNILKSHMNSNTKFVVDSFKTEMERVISEAKSSISGYIDNKIYSTGLDFLKNEISNPLLSENISTPKNVILEKFDNCYSLYYESGQAIPEDFDTEEEAFEYAKDNNLIVVESFNL